jgi:hypothetical protein
MRIEVRQQGGFAGVRPPPLVVDTADLAPQDAREVERLAEGLPEGNERAARGADLMRYDVTVGERTTTYYEPDVPDAVRRLLRVARDAGGDA